MFNPSCSGLDTCKPNVGLGLGLGDGRWLEEGEGPAWPSLQELLLLGLRSGSAGEGAGVGATTGPHVPQVPALLGLGFCCCCPCACWAAGLGATAPQVLQMLELGSGLCRGLFCCSGLSFC